MNSGISDADCVECAMFASLEDGYDARAEDTAEVLTMKIAAITALRKRQSIDDSYCMGSQNKPTLVDCCFSLFALFPLSRCIRCSKTFYVQHHLFILGCWL